MATHIMLDKRSLKQAGRELSQGSRSDRAVAAGKWKPALERYWKFLERRAAGLKDEWSERWEAWFSRPPASAEPIVWKAHINKTRLYRFVGCLGVIAEVLLAAMAAQNWAAGAWYFIVPFAIGLAILVTWALKALWLLGHDGTLPKYECRRRERAVWFCGALNVLALGTWGFVRFYAFVAVIVPWLLGALSIGLPLFAAGLFVLADLFDARNVLAREHEGMTAVIDHVVELLQKAEAAVQAPNGERIAEHLRPTTSGFRLAPTLNGILLATLGFSTFAADSSGEPPCPVDHLNVWVDVSGSAEPTQMMELKDVISRTIKGEPCVTKLWVFPFASAKSAISGPALRLDVPRSSFTCPPCVQETCHIKPVLDKHRKECEREEEKALEDQGVLWDAFDRNLSEIFTAVQHAPESPQTCLSQVLSRTLSERATVASVVVTDGVHFACGDERPRKGANDHVVVVLVSGKSDGDNLLELLEQREASLRRFDPGINVIPQYRLGDEAIPLLATLR